MRITSGGNVGIGEAVPNCKFDVVGASNASNTYGIITARNSSNGGISFGASSTSYVWIQGNVFGAGVAPIALNANGGNVLIGTTTDSGYKLDVNGTGRFSGGLNVNSTGTEMVNINVVDSSGRQGIRLNNGINSSSGIVAFNSASSTGTDTGGLLRIHQQSTSLSQPSAVFRQDGSADILQLQGASGALRFNIASTGAATFSSSVTATSFFESSDSRLKKLIQDNYQTKGIASITPKLYTKNGKVELGYYAQDFVGILDSAVSKGSDDMLSLSYREVLVAKVYALEQRIKELENK
jgi:hypothetical protein